MDRRQRKSREAIFNAFTNLLSQKDYGQITVGEIVDLADIGRATFYSHFETKDYLLKEFCEDLFCHIFDTEGKNKCIHKHIFDCEDGGSAFLHLFRHLQRNDNNILLLLSSPNNELFLKYFRTNLETLIDHHLYLFSKRKPGSIPDGYWRNYIVSTFIETLKWWVLNGMQESPEVITGYFYSLFEIEIN